MPMKWEKDGIPREKGADRHRKTGAKGAGSGLIPLLEAAEERNEILSVDLNGGGQDGRKS